jgi:hypothetical protein
VWKLTTKATKVETCLFSVVKVESMLIIWSLAESNVYICYSTEAVYKALQIKTEIAVGSAWGSFHTKLDFASGLQKNDTTMAILVIASKITPVPIGRLIRHLGHRADANSSNPCQVS